MYVFPVPSKKKQNNFKCLPVTTGPLIATTFARDAAFDGPPSEKSAAAWDDLIPGIYAPDILRLCAGLRAGKTDKKKTNFSRPRLC